MRVEIRGLSKLTRNLAADHLLADTWRKAMERVTQEAESEAKDRAPHLTGKLRASLTHRLDARPIPLYGVVTANAENKGFRYPFALDAGHRTPGRPHRRGVTVKRWRRQSYMRGTLIQLHYAGTGKSTAKWFSGSVDKIQGKINNILNDAARRIEQQWSKQ